jgi:hypothetical protein
LDAGDDIRKPGHGPIPVELRRAVGRRMGMEPPNTPD